MVIKFLEENSLNEPQKAHTTKQLTTQRLTGANSADVMSNIYDLEGNNVEWTAQASGANIRIVRGGYHYLADYGHFHPASGRHINNPCKLYSDFTSRSVLYL